MPLVDIRNVSRSYGHVHALRELDLSLEPGTIGLVGNNGAGKSTLLKILLGLLEPDTGSGTILGCDLRTGSTDLRARVGYMPEAAATVPVLRGVEFVTLAGDLYGMPHRDARRRAHEVLNYVGLGELRYRQLEEYSTGNLQRLKLAAALVHDPQLLLLDEPTNGLDPAGRVAMLRLIEDLIAETGKSVILCTHLLGDVERLCQQIVVLHQGRVVRAGTMDELRQATGNRYHITWDGGAGEAFLAALAETGLEVAPPSSANKVMVTIPAGFSTAGFFDLARRAGIVIVEMAQEEEDLEQLFYRVTDQDAHAAEVAAEHGALTRPAAVEKHPAVEDLTHGA
ncbi:MAG: ABC transporter ATP-binding protein [Pirellulales bacterium]|nr:ABC transporter ATP-binding protein [Pirellulales bacterium]